MTKTKEKKLNSSKANAKRKTKASIVEGLLAREDGASLDAIGKSTGWQTHSSRAFLTGLRKKGCELVRYKDGQGASIYKLTSRNVDEGTS
ncbi:hypothetical protein HME9302_02628 [Alteripontixanthobacter maritimus]|uniref:DUF3489 domain-containing protein n=1 Tax=Alteripontixanthobacter maritimus TaxID=2161824 RepID=A0A369Q6X7_9SPHN|nr:DUF3489 domain-containing protein [Alteripontixanthobacter maritimus]RDC58896.1 hypothetical protein HME9302_00072 [Alteripontixanthobacter maritimus]RDC61406.1 hypothetical protein HME9302_02628 [Alteripontixanthobacter maritimus]